MTSMHHPQPLEAHKYRLALEQTRDAIMFLDASGYHDCNQAALALFRVPDVATFLTTHPGIQLSPPYQPSGRPSPKAAQARIEEALHHGHAFFEWRHCTWDGVEFPSEISLNRIDWEEQPVLMVIVRDISERVAMETDLARKEAQYRLAQSSACFGIWEWDLAQGQIYWDSDCWTMLGYSADSARTLTIDEWRSMIPDEDLARIEPEIAQKQAQGERFSIEHRCRHARGGWLWLQCRGQTADFNEDGSPRRLIGTHADIDRLMRTEMALRERVKEMETLTEVIRLSIDTSRSTEEMLHALARLIPQGWQHPEYTAARIRAQGWEATSEGFRESGARQVATVQSSEAPVQVEVFQHDTAATTADPFLPQEQRLLDTIAEEIHQALRHRRALEALQEQATTDRLTGIRNRQHFEAELERALARTQRYGDAAALVLFDIDHFKVVNDTYGHNTGDEILKQLTSRVSAMLRREDLLGRWGGEEFLVLLPGNDGDGARRTAERLRACIEGEPFPEVGRVTISLGTTALQPEDDTTTLLSRVDQALYEAKTSGGRNTVAAH